MIEILAAPPYAAVQDLGREGHRSQGVPPAGAMDPESLTLGNLLVGNPADAAGIEWGLGAGRLRLGGGCRLCVTGDAEVAVDGETIPTWTVHAARAGTELALGVPRDARFAYLAVEGGVDVALVLGSRSTYLPGRFGGLEGRLLRRGDRLRTGPRGDQPGAPVDRTLPSELRPARAPSIRLVDGPQSGLFADEAWDRLLAGSFTIATASDRMGYRLEGPALEHRGDPAMPSEPACPGAVQVPQGAPPIVLMPDGPTVGGYPKLAVVASADLGPMAQLRPGDRPRFVRVSLEEALAARTEAGQRREGVRAWISATAR